jgi:hypothetical protein
MLRRFLFVTSAAALLVFGLGAFEARASSVILPVQLDPGLTTTTLSSPAVVTAVSNGNTTTVVGVESLTFSSFGYTSTATGANATAYPATAVGVSQLQGVVNETGIQFSAGWSAGPNSTLDQAFTFIVTAPKGELITDAYLLTAGLISGTGTATVGETITNTANNAFLGSLNALAPGSANTISFTGVQSVTVVKDMDLAVGATGSSSISVVQQGFSSQGKVPEPTSMALLGIGMAGFFTYRRLFKRAAPV